MGIAPARRTVLDLASGSLPDLPDVATPSMLDTIGASLRQNNIIGSAIGRIGNFKGVTNEDQPGYSAWDDIKGTPYEQHWDAFAHSNNSRYTAALKKQVDQEDEDRRTLDAAGWWGTLANVGSNIVDPTMLLPVGGEIIKGAQGAYKIADVGIRSAIAGATGAAVQEAGLHATQDTRTLEDSAYSVGGGFLLGGVLGTGVSAILSRGERQAALKAVDTLLPDEEIPAGPVSGGGGIGAEATSRSLPIEALSVDGTVAGATASASRFLTPNLRLNYSPSGVARQLGQELAEGTVYQVGHADGMTTGAAVERLAGMTTRARMATGMDQLRTAWLDAKRGGFKVSFDEFDQAVGRAMRSNDEGENAFVSRAAKELRGSVVEPFFQDGKAVGLYEDGDSVSFAPSYFPRQYRTKVLVAQEPQIKAEWSAYMERRIVGNYQEAAASLRAREGEIASAERDFSLTPEQRASALDETNKALGDLDRQSPDHAGLREEVERLRESDKAGASQMARDAGPEYAAYLKERERLLARAERLGEGDEARITEERGKLAATRERLQRAFADKWEIRNLGQNIDPYDPDALPSFKEMAKDIIDDVYDKLTGRDFGSSASVAPEYMTPIERGPVRERTLPIPDWMLQKQGVLEDRASQVLHRYSRTLAADVELSRKFGDPRMDEALRRLADDYAELRKGITDPKELAKLHARQLADQRDIEALRDLVRGTYRAAENASTFGRVVRAASHLNFVRQLGGVVVSSLSDIYRPAMVHGLRSFMADGIGPLLRESAGVKLSVREAKLAGTVVDRILSQRVSSYAAIADPYEHGTPIGRFLENLSRGASHWSGINIWTDGMKGLTSVMSQNRILSGEMDKRTLAFLGIDGDMAQRIERQFATHGETVDGVRVANTERWDDEHAVRAFRGAVGKDVDSIIVTPGHGDVPLFAHTPLGRLLLQFRSFMFAAHQRVLLRGMQENQMRFVSGMVGMSALGLLSTVLRAWRSGRDRHEKFEEAAKNPGYLLGEALDASGIFTLGFDFANTTEKMTQSLDPEFSFNPIKSPLGWAGRKLTGDTTPTGESVRFSSRSPLSTLLGPSAGMVEQAFIAGGAPITALRDGKVSDRQKRAMINLLPYNSYIGLKEATQALMGDSPYAAAEEGM